VQRQIARDVWLMKNMPNDVKGSVWHFFRSAETGQIGPAPELIQAFEKYGIKYLIHK
jgi:hypothetical protein